jgi:hypothetical protein
MGDAGGNFVEAVRDVYKRVSATATDCIYGVENDPPVFGVQSLAGLIEDQQPRILDRGARDQQGEGEHKLKRPVVLLVVGVALIVLTYVLTRMFGPASLAPNIVLISIDTLRADYFSPEHMPKMYAWAQENCAVFPNAYSNSTWTSPSHVTMLSGLLQSSTAWNTTTARFRPTSA